MVRRRPVCRDWDAGTLTISQQSFAENTALKFGVSSGRKSPLGKGHKLEEFDAAEPEGDWHLREMVGLPNVACHSDTSGYCQRGESGSQVHQLALGGTLEDGG